MIEAIERALARQEDLDKVKNCLLREEHDRHTERESEIEHDIRTAELIRYALNEPTGSPGFAVAKGLVRWYQKKHITAGPSLAEQLMRDIRKESWLEEHPENKEAKVNDDAEQTETP